jgi:hypothetical protein
LARLPFVSRGGNVIVGVASQAGVVTGSTMPQIMWQQTAGIRGDYRVAAGVPLQPAAIRASGIELPVTTRSGRYVDDRPHE